MARKQQLWSLFRVARADKSKRNSVERVGNIALPKSRAERVWQHSAVYPEWRGYSI